MKERMKDIFNCQQNFLHYYLLAETMYDVNNDVIPSQLKDLIIPTAKRLIIIIIIFIIYTKMCDSLPRK